ncbi:uracil phosphoribosyltransferase [Robertkochia marina]|uniref:Uracil phosphoribosyltransferase n=1 Tax=Robertkochia marina TaxID=1227945 RepID=A0A4S3M4U0_9FLAO|nr:uracil phosphoribosyltransferase [Robertkochia marina]THD69341.1 uracil phosphoribosyltransferase [Robertkochia marina]TRZ47398.1 uracil phosphoribosyltransferase [Robertkochia marina]
MSDFFYGIQYLFEEILFAPLHALRGMENWWTANTLNWIFMIIGAVAFVYWMGQLKKFNDNNEENKDITAHSYL